MRHSTLMAMIVSACFATATDAQQPPDSVMSDASNNTAMGENALLHNNNDEGSSDNTAAGASALINNTTGISNTALGSNALVGNTGGNENTAVGYGALYKNNNGYDNSAFGVSALNANTAGDDNTAIGSQALNSNTTGVYNSAVGNRTLFSNTDGGGNSAFGSLALQSSNGAENTAIGYAAMSDITSGSENTGLGVNALGVNVTGSANIAIGYNAGQSILGSNNIDIGNNGLNTDNGVIRIGTKGSQKSAVIVGIYTSPLEANSLPVYVNSAGRLSVGTSSERYKTDIAPMNDSTAKLQQLRPVTFHLKTHPRSALQYGLIAEEVAKVYPDLVVVDQHGKIQGVRYDELAPMLLNEAQKQAQDLHQLKEQVAMLARVNASMREEIAMMRSKDPRVAAR
jgi:endosialidase-like protein